MDIYEQSVMHCLVANGETFVSPQFNIGLGWSYPDFVGVRPPQKKVYIVEVSASGDLAGLVEKVLVRETQWISPLRNQLETTRVVGADWSYSVLLFVRCDQKTGLKSRLANEVGVTQLYLEDAIAHWEWNPKVWTTEFAFETDALKRAC